MRRLFLAVFSLLLVCCLVEVVLRTTHLFGARVAWTQPDREIGWRFTPGHAYWFFAEGDQPVTGRINSMGWRDREHPDTPAAGTERVAVLGDSYVEAFQVRSSATFVAIGDERLHPDGEVMNFGRSGMSPTEELIVLERDVLPRKPDLVVLVFTPQNDIADVNPATAADLCRPFFRRVSGDSLALDLSFVHRRDFRIREAINPFKQHSALVSLVSERFNAWRFVHRRQAVEGVRGMTREQRMCTAHPDPVFAGNYTLCKTLIVRMARACAARGVHFELASVPIAYQDELVARLRAEDATFDPEFFDRDLSELALANDFAFVALTQPFTERWRATRRPLHWQHWNYAGHRLVADLLFSRARLRAVMPEARSTH